METEARFLFEEPLRSVVTPNRYVDIQCLHAIWPEALGNCRIMLFTMMGTIYQQSIESVATYTLAKTATATASVSDQAKSASAPVKDVILHLYNGHFTWLEPDFLNDEDSVVSESHCSIYVVCAPYYMCILRIHMCPLSMCHLRPSHCFIYPHTLSVFSQWSDHPIDDLTLAIREFNVTHPDERVCLQEYTIGEFLLQPANEEGQTTNTSSS
jgi:hypothetical protein